MRAAEHGAVMELLPDVLVFRRIHHNNLSRQEGSESREEYLLLVKAFLDRRRNHEKTYSSPNLFSKKDKGN
jgi:hypothetical protein